MIKKGWIIIVLALAFISSQVSAQMLNENVYKFSRVLGYVDGYYVDSVDTEDLVEEAIVAMLKKLDPHTVYISKEEVKRMNEPLQGNFEGIGVQFNILNDTLMVVSPITGGPSEKVGILAGDRIVRIDTEFVAGIGLTNQMVFDRLRGDKGTRVSLGINRRGVKGEIDFEVIRDKIPIHSLDAAYMVSRKNKIAYVKLNRFSATTMTEYSEAMKKLKSEGAEHLILDLTNNGGGYLNQAFELADEFLEQGQMVVYTEGLHSKREDYLSTRRSMNDYGKVVLMIDEGSASASEIVSGAIQDWDRGVIVGRRSFGKGLVQRPVNLPDGSMMRLTVARYYTPTGRLIQKSYSEGLDEYRNDLVNRYNSGELSNEDSVHFPDSLKYETLVNKRNVYGGGGIMPDIFVPIDTNAYSDYYRDLIRKGIINKFILQYMDNHRAKLDETYTNKGDKGFDHFMKSFDVDDAFMKELTDFGVAEGLEFNEEGFEVSKAHLRVNMKAYIARDLWDVSEFFEIINVLDPVFNEALKVIQDDVLYKSKLKPNN